MDNPEGNENTLEPWVFPRHLFLTDRDDGTVCEESAFRIREVVIPKLQPEEKTAKDSDRERKTSEASDERASTTSSEGTCKEKREEIQKVEIDAMAEHVGTGDEPTLTLA